MPLKSKNFENSERNSRPPGYWRVELTTSCGTIRNVLTTEELAKEFYSSWLEAEDSFDNNEKTELIGFLDDAIRSPHKLAIRYAAIESIEIYAVHIAIGKFGQSKQPSVSSDESSGSSGGKER